MTLQENEQNKADKSTSLKEAVVEQTERLGQTAQHAKQQFEETVADGKEKIAEEVREINSSVQEQIGQFKNDLLQRMAGTGI